MAKSAPKPCARRPAAVLEGGMAEAVVGGALLGVLQDVVGLVDFLEMCSQSLSPGLRSGMPLHRELAKGGLDLRLARGALNAETLVVVSASTITRHPMTSNHAELRRLPPKTCTPGLRPGVQF